MKSIQCRTSPAGLGLALAAALAVISCQKTADTTTSSVHIEAPSRDESGKTFANEFQPTIENNRNAVGPANEGMAWIPGGEFSMGAIEPPDMDEVGMKATLDARPIHRVYVDGFYMDKTDVTNAQFKFVKATGYVTVAERTSRAEDYPGAIPENLVPGGVVFSPPDHPVPLDNHFQWWSYGEMSSAPRENTWPIPIKATSLTRIQVTMDLPASRL